MALNGDFQDSARFPPPGYHEVGAADPNEPGTVTLYLRRRPSEGLIASLPSFGAIPPLGRRYPESRRSEP